MLIDSAESRVSHCSTCFYPHYVFAYAQVPKRERITLRCSALAKERQQNVNRDPLLCPSYYNHSIKAYSQLPLSLRAFLGDSEVVLNDLEKGQVQTSVSKYSNTGTTCQISEDAGRS